MPEGDTVHLEASRLHSVLAGRVLTRAELRVPRYATSELAGRRVLEVVARGKHLLHRIEEGLTLHTHLKMEGSWHIYRAGERWRRPGFQARAILATEQHETVGFSLGAVELLETRREADAVGHLGPDLLGPDWDEPEAIRRMVADPERPVGEVLLDQTVMAGLGNVYRSEVCYLTGVHPDAPVGRCDAGRVVALAKRLIESNRTTGMQVTTGDPRPGRHRWVYGRAGRPCRRCGTQIRGRGSEAGGRVLYWCPACQPEPAGARPDASSTPEGGDLQPDP